MKKLILTVTMDLPEDEFERATILSKLRLPLEGFREAAVGCGAPAETSVQIVTARARRGRPRRPREAVAAQ